MLIIGLATGPPPGGKAALGSRETPIPTSLILREFPQQIPRSGPLGGVRGRCLQVAHGLLPATQLDRAVAEQELHPATAG
jgi:hypothetical protein